MFLTNCFSHISPLAPLLPHSSNKTVYNYDFLHVITASCVPEHIETYCIHNNWIPDEMIYMCSVCCAPSRRLDNEFMPTHSNIPRSSTYIWENIPCHLRAWNGIVFHFVCSDSAAPKEKRPNFPLFCSHVWLTTANTKDTHVSLIINHRSTICSTFSLLFIMIILQAPVVAVWHMIQIIVIHSTPSGSFLKMQCLLGLSSLSERVRPRLTYSSIHRDRFHDLMVCSSGSQNEPCHTTARHCLPQIIMIFECNINLNTISFDASATIIESSSSNIHIKW